MILFNTTVYKMNCENSLIFLIFALPELKSVVPFYLICLNNMLKYKQIYCHSLVLRIAVVWFLWLMAPDSLGYNRGRYFRMVPSADGLSQASVLSMVQDSIGFLWVGTKEGLNRFDGYEFINYKYDPKSENSLSNNEISCLEVEGGRYLWVGTRSGGVNRLELSTGNITRYDNLTNDGLVRVIFLDSKDNLWVGTTEGLFLFGKDESGERTHIINQSRNAVYRHETNEPFIPGRLSVSIASILELEPGKLMVGAEHGLYEYNIEHNDFKSVSPLTLDVTIFTDIIRDKQGDIWAGSYDGLFRLRKNHRLSEYDLIIYNTQQPMEWRLPVDWVEQLVEDNQGNIWVGTHGGGLTQINNGRVESVFTYASQELGDLPDNQINSLVIDRSGILWIGTESKGLVYLDLLAKQFNTVFPATPYRKGLSDNLVTAVTGNEQTLWVGTSAAGIDVFRIDGQRLEFERNIPRVILTTELWKSEIISLLCDDDEQLWIGSASNRLVSYSENAGFDSYVVNGFVLSLFEDKRGNVWFGTWGQGLGFINKKTRSVVQYSQTLDSDQGLSSDKVLSILIDSNDYLWVGTKGGGLSVARLNHILNRTGRFYNLKHVPGQVNSLSYNDVYSILEGKDGSIWFATGSGLNKLKIPDGLPLEQALDQNQVFFEHLTEKEGLTGGLVYSLQEDDKGNLWLGTNKGITRFAPSENRMVTYGPNDGLPSAKFHSNGSFKQKNGGLMVFGGVDGITFFYPDSILPNPNPASVRLTALRLHNRLVVPGEKINGRKVLTKNISHTDNLALAFSDNEITFEFSALHFSSPDKNRYKYRLLGFNNQWQETGSQNRRATYTNLRPGEYVFEVTATNNDGEPSDQVARLNLKILPPWWLKPWAYAIYLTFFLFMLWIFRRYSLIGVKKKNRLIIESMEHKKETEIAEAKMRFFTNVSHEIRTPLTLIHAPLQQLLHRQHDQQTHEALLMIHRNVKRLLNQVNQLLELRRMEKGHFDFNVTSFSLDLLLQEVLPSFETLRKQKDLTIEVVKSGSCFVKADRNLMATVVYNLISNSLKFTPEKGRLSLEIIGMEPSFEDIGVTDQRIVLKVCDTGPGIPESELQNVFNRFYQLRNQNNEHLAGSGIGLSIVKEFVERNNGTIKVYNQPLKGCCFEINLPAGIEVSEVPVTEELVISSGEVTPEIECVEPDEKKQKQSKIFIVEDDVELAAYLKSFFATDYDTYYVHDGAKAWEIVAELNPDVMICDVMLPGLNGMELCRRMKRNEDTSHIPVIMLTAKTEEESMVEGLTSGADSYLVKPFNVNVLSAQVVSLLKSREIFRSRFSQQFVLEPTEEAITPMDEKFLTKLIETIETNLADPSFDVPQLIEAMHMSHSIILKKVKSLTGLSLVEFIRSMRIKKAAQIFKQDKLSVSEVGFMVGFSDPKYFSKCFAREIGMKPTDYIKEIHS